MFNKNILTINCQKEAERIQHFIKEQVFTYFKHRGTVVGLSGGIDSALVSTLCVNALGKEKVLGLILPEKESSPISKTYAHNHAKRLGIQVEEVDITQHLEALGIYNERNSVIKKLFPDYDDDYTFNVTLPQNLLDKDRISYHTITIQSPQNQTQTLEHFVDQAQLNIMNEHVIVFKSVLEGLWSGIIVSGVMTICVVLIKSATALFLA